MPPISILPPGVAQVHMFRDSIAVRYLANMARLCAELIVSINGIPRHYDDLGRESPYPPTEYTVAELDTINPNWRENTRVHQLSVPMRTGIEAANDITLTDHRFYEVMNSTPQDDDHVICAEYMNSPGCVTNFRSASNDHIFPRARWTLAYTKSNNRRKRNITDVCHFTPNCCGMSDPQPVLIHERYVPSQRWCKHCTGTSVKVYGPIG